MLGFLFIVLLVILVIFLALKPQRPRFYLENVMVHKMNVSDGLLTSNMWFIVVSHNLNYNIGVV
jgi:preprotein translocase subunit YajC